MHGPPRGLIGLKVYQTAPHMLMPLKPSPISDCSAWTRWSKAAILKAGDKVQTAFMLLVYKSSDS